MSFSTFQIAIYPNLELKTKFGLTLDKKDNSSQIWFFPLMGIIKKKLVSQLSKLPFIQIWNLKPNLD